MRNRRELIALLGGVAVWPYTVRAQQPPTPVIGFLSGGSLDSYAPLVAAFRQALGEAGFVEGRTIAIEYRWAEGQTERLPALAADLVRLQVALIAATGGHRGGARRQGRDHDDTDRLHLRRRSGPLGPRRQP